MVSAQLAGATMANKLMPVSSAVANILLVQIPRIIRAPWCDERERAGPDHQGQTRIAKHLGGLRLDNHAAFHLHVQCMAEPLTVVPVHPRAIRHKGHRRGLLW